MAGFGSAALWIALAAALVALVAYLTAVGGNEGGRRLGRLAFVLSTLGVVVASALLLVAFHRSRFDIQYVADYSARNLPALYRVSAFWAGQEGSFLLWALLGALMGLVLLRKAGEWEATVMPVFTAAQAYLLLLLVMKNPLRPAAEVHADGHGLNPLLQDPWMAIHPPMIFLGYAALAIPFAFAVAALLRRDYDRWVVRALPWTLFAWVALGAGIFIGGYWAYRVLGWGGYWGWDPVENASLIPWLICTALIHGMLLQRTRASLKRGNLLLAIGAFTMVLYGTFLTRSGVLKDFSVHSFADPGKALYTVLFAGIRLALFAPLALLLRRVREIQTGVTYDNLLSRDFAFFLGILVVCISAALVTFGTSAPIFTRGQMSPQPGYYNVTHFPVGVLLALLVGLAPLLAWRQIEAPALLRRLWGPAAVGIAAVILAVGLGVHQRNAWMLLLVGAAAFALFADLAATLRALRTQPLSSGGHLAHVGLALMLIGIVGSSVCSRAEKVSLAPGQSAQALGYQVTYRGHTRPDESRRHLRLTLAKGGREFEAEPRMIFSPQMQSWVKSPAVHKYWLQDLYVSPLELREQEEGGIAEGELDKGEALKAGGYTFTFQRWEMSGHMGAADSAIGAVFEVVTPDGKRLTATPTVTPGGEQGLVPTPATVPGTELTLHILGINVPKVQLGVSGLPTKAPAGPTEELVVEVSNKPLINILWLGSVLVLLGGLIASVRRARENAKLKELAPAAAEPAAGNGRTHRKQRPTPVS